MDAALGMKTGTSARFVSAEGRVVKDGGATVKNVRGFDLCRLLVGSWGTLGFLGEAKALIKK